MLWRLVVSYWQNQTNIEAGKPLRVLTLGCSGHLSLGQVLCAEEGKLMSPELWPVFDMVISMVGREQEGKALKKHLGVLCFIINSTASCEWELPLELRPYLKIVRERGLVLAGLPCVLPTDCWKPMEGNGPVKWAALLCFPQAKYISQCIDEIKQELKQDNIAVKANAVCKLTYVSAWLNTALSPVSLLTCWLAAGLFLGCAFVAAPSWRHVLQVAVLPRASLPPVPAHSFPVLVLALLFVRLHLAELGQQTELLKANPITE